MEFFLGKRQKLGDGPEKADIEGLIVDFGLFEIGEVDGRFRRLVFLLFIVEVFDDAFDLAFGGVGKGGQFMNKLFFEGVEFGSLLYFIDHGLLFLVKVVYLNF